MKATALLSQTAEEVRQTLETFETYSFAQDVQSRMVCLQLSAVALAERCSVSHTMVDKWRQGKAKPNGKERMKELGMALGMDTGELNAFLYKNGYPKLYAKNPLDSAAKLLLLSHAGREDIIVLYRELIERLGLSAYAPNANTTPLSTTALSGALYDAAQQGQVSGWFLQHQKDFTADAKTQLPDQRLGIFIQLYMGDATIHEMSVTGELPVILRNLLYPIQGGKAITTRYLRDKLIAFGLYSNMTEEELDTLLSLARLRPFSEAETVLDAAMLSALRCGHEHYPGYEYENLCRITKRLKHTTSEYEQALLSEYQQRLSLSEKLMNYYDNSQKDAEQQAFEEHYTALSDRGLMDYVRDVLTLLKEDGLLSGSEADPMIELITRTSADTLTEV